MDFKSVTKNVVAAFAEHDVSYALIGGYAVSLWGVHRGTVDMDFLVRMDDMAKVRPIMTSLGYECVFSSKNVTQYVSPLVIFGEIDFVHAFREASLAMLDRAVEKTLFGDGVSMKVLVPEDLIGLKLQAIANGRDRNGIDRMDIEKLMEIHSEKLDWDLIEEYFDIFESRELFEELRGKYCANK